MHVGRTIPFHLVWHFGLRHSLKMLSLSSAVYFDHAWLDWTWLMIPFLPISTVGAAVAFYVGFKNNSAYERSWEARRVWGGITNSSRSFAMSAMSLIGRREPEKGLLPSPAHRELVYRQLAWVNALRLQLRQPSALNGGRDYLPQATAMKHPAPVAFPVALEAELTRLLPDED